MIYRPDDYQVQATKFIEEHPVSAIFLECGLGKTAITLTAIKNLMHESFEVSKVLVIAPIRVATNTWPDELTKWDHVRDLTFSVAVGTAKQRLDALNKNADLYIINRENVKWLIDESGLPFDYDMVVIDELSSFKSNQAQRFKALLMVRPKIKRIVGLTGSPAPNGLLDLWAQFRILDMGERLGRFITRYRTDYFLPDRTNCQIVYSYKPRPGAEKAIYDKISDITISMQANDHIKMPDLVSTSVKVTLTDKETTLYRKLKKDLVLGSNITAANAAVLCGKLCQLANGCIYTDDGNPMPVHDHKLDALEDIIEAANGKTVLVAYWYKHDLQRIKQRLDSIGATYRELKDQKSIVAWNNMEIQVGLIHPASAGHGLNLQSGGHHLVWYGLTWSLEYYQQTVARLYRQGQQSDTVVVQHIITAGTIDERIMKAISGKAATQDELVKAVKAEVEL